MLLNQNKYFTGGGTTALYAAKMNLKVLMAKGSFNNRPTLLRVIRRTCQIAFSQVPEYIYNIFRQILEMSVTS